MAPTRSTGRLSSLAALITAPLVLLACSEPGTDDGDGASAAGESPGPSTLTVYTSEPQEKIEELNAAFNEEHPDITVEVFRAGTGDLTARIAAERETGSIAADVLLAADTATFEGYKSEDLLLQYSPEGVEDLQQDVVDPDGYYVGTRIIPTVIAYNTNEVEEPPTAWAELADEQWADQIVMPNPDVSGAAAYNAAVWFNTESLGTDWFEALGQNNPLIADSNGPAAQAVADGSRPVGVVVDYLIRELAEQGSPVAVSYPDDGVPYVSQPVGIFTDSENVEAAQVYVDFLVSQAGQALAVEQSYLPVRDDVGSPEGAPELSEISLLSPDLDTITSTRGEALEAFKSSVG